jgi:paired amphipathic helix protein Sin3a
LFKGHPLLISGFNTFLPPGYRIECSTDPREPDLITVTTPSGVTTTTGGSMNRMHLDTENSATGMHGHHLHHGPPPPMPPQPYYPYSHIPPPPIQQNPPPGMPMHAIPPPQQQQQQQQPPMMSQPLYHAPPPPPQQQQQQSHNRPLPPHPSSLHHSPSQQSITGEKRSPVEFNHAINYVNKIKVMFICFYLVEYDNNTI